MNFLVLAAGLGLLTAGAEALVRGASGIAKGLKISPLIIGLTVVGFGTSAPEFAVSAEAAWRGQADIALGNVVGSNILNVLLILGLSALVAPLLIPSQLLRLDVPLMIGASLLTLALALDGRIDRLEGSALFGSLVLYLAFQIRQGWTERWSAPDAQESLVHTPGAGKGKWLLDILSVAGGLALLVWGARILVTSAVAIAQSMGVSELVIGLTIVALGTSLPELATSVVASIRREREIAVGNVVGSNLFNLLGVLGFASLLSPSSIPVAARALHFDLPVMLIVAIVCVPIFVTGRISRWEGALFFSYYLGYTVYVVLVATQHPSLVLYRTAMIWFVLPLTALALTLLPFVHKHQKGMMGFGLAASTYGEDDP